MKSVLFILLLSVFSVATLRAQCEPTLTCPAAPVEVADYTANDAGLWNAIVWWDAANSQHDLGEAPAEIKLEAYDLCGTGLIARVELLLDLDGNGTQETVVDSDSLANYEPGKVPFGNFNNPAYDGTRRAFDQRPVAAGDRYRFALVHTQTNDNHTFRLVWTTDNAPDVHTDPQLPTLGTANYTVRWTVHDDNDDYSFCNYDLTVRDKKLPTIVCINGLAVNIMQTQLVTLWASDFYLYGEDNLTPNNQIKIGIRKAGTGTGFPFDAFGNPITSITFTCSELGTQFVELWGIDAAGNADFCETYILVQDNMGSCTLTPPAGPSLCIEWCNGGTNVGIEEVQFEVEGQSPGLPPMTVLIPATDPSQSVCYNIDLNGVPTPANATIRPLKLDNPLNGVSTFDLVLIRRHIFGDELFANPCQIIAADANRSNSVTLADVVELRKLILGIYSELPNNESWRFFVEPDSIPNPLDPFVPALVESLPVSALTNPMALPPDFWMVKVGDVNGSALPNSVAPPGGSDFVLALEDRSFATGQTVRVPVTAAQIADLLGLQLALETTTPGLHFEAIEPGAWRDLTTDCFAVRGGGRRVNVSWATDQVQSLASGDVLFTLVFRATQPGRLSASLALAAAPIEPEVYNAAFERQLLHLVFSTPGQSADVVGAPRPNPVVLGLPVELPVMLTTETTVRYEITDLAGRVLTSGHTILPAGESRLHLPTQHLAAAGCYGYRVQTGSEMRVGSIVVR